MSTLPSPFIYHYQPEPDPVGARCQIQFFIAPTGDAVVVATELPDNPGKSITSAAGEIATALLRDYQLDPELLVCIEHYPERSLCARLHSGEL